MRQNVASWKSSAAPPPGGGKDRPSSRNTTTTSLANRGRRQEMAMLYKKKPRTTTKAKETMSTQKKAVQPVTPQQQQMPGSYTMEQGEFVQFRLGVSFAMVTNAKMDIRSANQSLFVFNRPFQNSNERPASLGRATA